MNRRNFLSVSGGLVASWTLPIPQTPAKPVKAILFDAFPIFDPAPVATLTTQFFPEQATNLLAIWRTRQFEYTWLRSLSGTYADFLTITSDALDYAAASQKLVITPQQHRQLLAAYHQLTTWPEVPTVLTQLKEKGYRLGFLSNFTPEMLQNNTRNNGLGPYFEQLISVDRVRTYKPDPRTYRLAMDIFQLSKEEIIFVPFAGWDAAGATNFGYRTFWVNRLNTPPERLGPTPERLGPIPERQGPTPERPGVTPDGEGGDLHDLVEWLAGAK